MEPVDTEKALYWKLKQASVALLQETWPLIKAGKALRIPHSSQAGTYHHTRDAQLVNEVELNRAYIARDLINVLRVRTFAPYKGTCFIINGKKVYMPPHLEYSEEER